MVLDQLTLIPHFLMIFYLLSFVFVYCYLQLKVASHLLLKSFTDLNPTSITINFFEALGLASFLEDFPSLNFQQAVSKGLFFFIFGFLRSN